MPLFTREFVDKNGVPLRGTRVRFYLSPLRVVTIPSKHMPSENSRR